MYNGNWFGVKIKPSMLDLYVEDQFIGKVHLDKKVKMKSKRETDLSAPFTAQLEDGAMLKLLKHATKSEINVRLKGKVKAIQPYGAFVEIGANTQGLLHISEIEWSRLEKVESVLKVDQEIEVKLLGIERGKLKLSRKVLLPKPEKAEESK